jgi:hypothetical protein
MASKIMPCKKDNLKDNILTAFCTSYIKEKTRQPTHFLYKERSPFPGETKKKCHIEGENKKL